MFYVFHLFKLYDAGTKLSKLHDLNFVTSVCFTYNEISLAGK